MTGDAQCPASEQPKIALDPSLAPQALPPERGPRHPDHPGPPAHPSWRHGVWWYLLLEGCRGSWMKGDTGWPSPLLGSGRGAVCAQRWLQGKQVPTWAGPSRGRPLFVGLVNHGLTCYLNALLQCLFVTPEFRDRVQEAPRSSRQQQALEQIFGGLEARRSPVETRALTTCLGLGYGQQDVGEVFLLLLDKLGRGNLQELFQSEVETVVSCARCGSEDHIPPGGRTLLLPLASLSQHHGLHGFRQAPREPPREPAGRAQDTGALSGPHIQHFDEDDNLFCERCDAKTPASEEQRFLRLPKILVLQVSEFTFKKGKFHKAQATANVSHVLELQTAPRAPAAPHSSGSRGATVTPAPERKRYHLYAMCSHWGDYSGVHYTAFVQPPGQEQWYHFDDQRVDRVGSFPQQFTHRSRLPYLLMYRCQDSSDRCGDEADMERPTGNGAEDPDADRLELMPGTRPATEPVQGPAQLLGAQGPCPALPCPALGRGLPTRPGQEP
nr:ubiquitin carboxyl-terminal hydrolase 47-like [Dasypus novemcinctus]